MILELDVVIFVQLDVLKHGFESLDVLNAVLVLPKSGEDGVLVECCVLHIFPTDYESISNTVVMHATLTETCRWKNALLLLAIQVDTYPELAYHILLALFVVRRALLQQALH